MRRLAKDFRITHATIEIEYGACGDDTPPTKPVSLAAG